MHCTDAESSVPSEQLYTRHAQTRAQQRSIRPFLVELLLNFGKPQRSHKADLYTFDKKSRQNMRHHFGSEYYLQIEPRLDCWAVVGDDGAVITLGHRTRRFKH
jgi:hypothetical protein